MRKGGVTRRSGFAARVSRAGRFPFPQMLQAICVSGFTALRPDWQRAMPYGRL